MFSDEPSHISESASATVFLQWLREGNGVFWIKGLPGSGKSTFMKFLAGSNNQNVRTLRCLETWARPRRPRILSFYFWLDDSSNIQNRVLGFLCSLLHQLLSQASAEYASNLLPMDELRMKRRRDNWDSKRLMSLLEAVARDVAKDTPLCIFIDALDECKEDLHPIVEIFKTLVFDSDSNIKCCVSSRSEPRLENRLRHLEPLTLEFHKLTHDDIWRHVGNEFKKCWHLKDLVIPTNEQKDDLVNKVVESSHGVFLWAFLVTKSLCKSIEDGDTPRQIQEQLGRLPKGMMQLYETMLEKSGFSEGERGAEAAAYFKFVIEHHQHTLFHRFHHQYTLFHRFGPYAVGITCEIRPLEPFIPLYEYFHGPTQDQDLSNITRRIRERIERLCAGMVVIRESNYTLDDPVYEVDFFHRTARDFFHEAPGSDILKQCKLTQLERYCLWVDGLCKSDHSHCNSAVNRCQSIPYKLSAYDARNMISWAKEMETSSHADRLSYLQHIDKSLSILYVAKNRNTIEDWVYEQSKSFHGDDQVLDFTALVIQQGWTEWLSFYSTSGQDMSTRYKDYLLLCCSAVCPYYTPTSTWDLSSIAKLLEAGASPNATFYWGMQNRMKTSPWLSYLVRLHSHLRTFRWSEEDRDLETGKLETLLDHEASLDDRCVFLTRLDSGPGSGLYPVSPRLLPLLSVDDLSEIKGSLFVVEVNAKYILEELCAHGIKHTVAEHRAMAAKILSRPDVQRSKSHRRILLVHPGYTENDLPPQSRTEDAARAPSKHHSTPFAEIGVHDSERLIESLAGFPVSLGYSYASHPAKKMKRKDRETRDIWQRSPKVSDLRQYLEERGYYKKEDDPAIPQGPIPMFDS